ncbi:MAG: D-alanine--D-alanine ligase [Ignavibacteriae bacterium]|nr:MAG: D-alanine--D-alanine ligase [Ignavibacteriota bacterium]
MNVVVLLGGISPERNISLLSGRAIVKGLRGQGHTVKAVDPSRGANGLMTDEELAQASAVEVTAEELASFQPSSLVSCVLSPLLDDVDIVFIALHGRYGEDGYIQSLLDLRGVKYTGSGMVASAVAMDKAMTKMLFQVGGIPTAFWVVVKPEDADNLDMLDEIRRELSGKIVVKPNDQGSTVGLTILDANDVGALQQAIRAAAQFTQTILIERYIAGRELTVTVLGNEALPVIEIEPKAGIYDYANKYTKGKTEYHCPADLTEEVRDHVMSLAVTAHHILGCKAYSRVDFRLNDENIPVCLEVNTSPGFTELSLVPMSAREAGIEFGPLCDEIIRLSLED